jgi:hypothetical protein
MKKYEATKIIIQESKFPQLNDVPKKGKRKRKKRTMNHLTQLVGT